MGKIESAYNLFQRATRIDLGENMNSSDKGLHSASLGGLWQAIVFGFAGFNYKDKKVYLKPNLPDRWNMVSFQTKVGNNVYQLTITKGKISIKEIKIKEPILFIVNGTPHQVEGKINIKY
jgi:hypothetical glycosyl hydrolase